MKEAFRKIPAPLQKQILIRLAGSGLGIALLILILSLQWDWQLLFPGISIFLVFSTDAYLLFQKCARERYVVIQGICKEIEKTGIRKKVKAAYIQCEDRCVKVTQQIQKIRNLTIGDKLSIYVSETAPVYEHDGCLVIMNVITARKEW